MSDVDVLVGVVVLMLAAGIGVLKIIRRYGKDAVAGRQSIGWTPLKGRRW